MPNAGTFGGTVRAVTRSGRGKAKAAPRAEALHLEAVEGGCDDYDYDLMPDAIMFTTVMNAWADVRGAHVFKSKEGRDGDRDTPSHHPAERAEALLRRMDHLHRAGVANAKSDAVSYCTAIKEWSAAASYVPSGARNFAEDEDVDQDDDEPPPPRPPDHAECRARRIPPPQIARRLHMSPPRRLRCRR